MRENRIMLISLFVCSLLVATSLSAAVLEMSIDDLALKAEEVIAGEVVDRYCEEMADGIIVTHVVIDVDRALYGTMGRGYAIVQHQGGEVEDLGLWVSDQPVFEVGQKVIVFVQQDLNSDYLRVTGLYQGKYTVEHGIVIETGLTVREFVDAIQGRRIDDVEPLACTVGELGMYWHSLPVVVYANSAGTGDCTGEFPALLRGGRTWNNVSSCDFRFASGGKNSGSSPTYDGKNQLQWRYMGQGYVAACYIWYSGNRMNETDFVFEDSYSWAAQVSGCPSGKMDVQNIFTHEAGHSVGLEDEYSSGCSEATMYGYVSYAETKKRTLTQDDINAIRGIY